MHSDQRRPSGIEELCILQSFTERVNLSHFHLLSVIGKGSYAKVVMVRKKDDGTVFALKVLKKSHIEKTNQVKRVQVERDVLLETSHPFIVRLAYAFQNEKKLYFCLEFCPGGELYNLLQQKQNFTEEQAKFYAAQMVLAIEHLHSKDIIYRDLKPENVLIDRAGYIRLTDFGLSKRGVSGNVGALSICGTPEYIAPEMLSIKTHGKAADWWTLGAIIYEMVFGCPPFYAENRGPELFYKIQFRPVQYPGNISHNLRSLLDGLFQKDPQKRLGSGGAREIKDHPFFKGYDWNALLNMKIKPPYVPVLSDETDVTNFAPEFVSESINSISINDDTSVPLHSYNGFTYQQSGECNKVQSQSPELIGGISMEEFIMNEEIYCGSSIRERQKLIQF